MRHIWFARSDAHKAQVDEIVAWLGVEELLEGLHNLPPRQEFGLLLAFLVEYAGGLELARHRMEDMWVDQAVYIYQASTIAVEKLMDRINVLYLNEIVGGDN